MWFCWHLCSVFCFSTLAVNTNSAQHIKYGSRYDNGFIDKIACLIVATTKIKYCGEICPDLTRIPSGSRPWTTPSR